MVMKKELGNECFCKFQYLKMDCQGDKERTEGGNLRRALK